MKSGVRVTILIVFLLLQVLLGNAVADIGEGPGIADVNEFQMLFASGEYERAANVYKERSLNQIRMLDDYRTFLNIWEALQGDEVNYALLISQLKVLQQRGFKTDGWIASIDAWLSYVNGRQAESVGNYEDALTAYERAGGLEDSIQRIEICLVQRQSMLEQQAKSLMEKGIAEKNVESLEQARELYISMGKKDLAQTCEDTIGQLAIEQKYMEAIAMYQEGIAQDNRNMIELSAQKFTKLGEYQECAIYLARCQQWLKNDERTIDISVASQSNGVIVSWTDSGAVAEGNTYQVSLIQKAFTKLTKTVQVENASELSIDGLIPEVTYLINVRDVQSGKNAMSKEIVVPKADPFSRWGLQGGDIRLEMTDRSLLTTFNYWELREKYLMSSIDDFAMASGNVQSQSGSCFAVVPFSVDESAEIDLPCRWILRTEANGTYASDVIREQGLVQPNTRPFFVSWNQADGINMIDVLLNELYLANERIWPETTLCIEFYLDDQLVTRTHFEMKNGK
mgnify:CR=1 FL=1